MKKLLLSTALAGVVLSTSAIAQTTVGGNMTVGLRATEEKGISGAATTASKRGMLMETQLNVASKGALNNGMSYAAGFSLEFDANDYPSSTSTKSIANENVYIDLISGNTTFSAGIDHMNDFDRSMIPVVGEIGKGTGSQGGTTAVTNMLADPLNTSAAAGVAVRQAFPGVGQITLAYTPTMSCNSTDIAGCGGADTTVVEGNEGSAYSALLEISNVGLKGLSLEYGYTEQAKKIGSTTSVTRDATFMTAGLRYTDGAISAGYNRKKFEFGGASATAPTTVSGGYTANEERTQDDFGIAYTVGNVSYGAIYQRTESNIATELDEKYKAIAIGYNMGPVAAKANFGKHENLGGLAGTDADIVTLKLSTNF
jgi:hypothetical protein